MKKRQQSVGALPIAGLAAAFLALTMVQSAFSQQTTADPLVGIGADIWKTRANCNECHGWLGNGEPEDPRSPKGANLRETKLTRADIAETIKCGRPGTSMPYFDRLAYTDGRCYGVTAATLGDKVPRNGAVQLSQREIDALAAFIEAQ